MKTNLFILALIAFLGGTPVWADRDGGGDVGSNGQGSGEIMGDVGGNGQGNGGETNGDVGGNGQGNGPGAEFQVGQRLHFYAAAVQRAKETADGDILAAADRLSEILPLVTVRVDRKVGKFKNSTDDHGAGVLEVRHNLIVLSEAVFANLSQKEKAAVLTHHLTKVAGISEESVRDAIGVSIR